MDDPWLAELVCENDLLKKRIEDAEIALRTWDVGRNSEYWLRHGAPTETTLRSCECGITPMGRCPVCLTLAGA